MTESKTSVLTIARGRAKHLDNLIRGLTQQSVLPCELVVAAMQDDLYDVPDAPFPIRQLRVPGNPIPLARARNAAAEAATGDHLIFLDIDCIPHPHLVAEYRDVRESGGVAMGEVLYLPDGATDSGFDPARFDELGQRHSDRRGPPADAPDRCKDYRCFWSLSFALSRADWDLTGGFDTRYEGYGGEDTDFGRMIDAAGLPLWWIRGARAYHQYHPHAMPPVHHLASVVANAERFAEKWGHRTMEHWLRAFRLMGLIDIVDGRVRILREPNEADLALCRQQADQPFASSRKVLEMLERQAAETTAAVAAE